MSSHSFPYCTISICTKLVYRMPKPRSYIMNRTILYSMWSFETCRLVGVQIGYRLERDTKDPRIPMMMPIISHQLSSYASLLIGCCCVEQHDFKVTVVCNVAFCCSIDCMCTFSVDNPSFCFLGRTDSIFVGGGAII
jgi:hypothetical protein